jgi:hypothetical protein
VDRLATVHQRVGNCLHGSCYVTYGGLLLWALGRSGLALDHLQTEVVLMKDLAANDAPFRDPNPMVQAAPVCSVKLLLIKVPSA